jgi:hypothetical protein
LTSASSVLELNDREERENCKKIFLLQQRQDRIEIYRKLFKLYLPFPFLSITVSFWLAETQQTKEVIATAEIQKSLPCILNLSWLQEIRGNISL